MSTFIVIAAIMAAIAASAVAFPLLRHRQSRLPGVLAMVAQLEARMRAQPNDAEGWLMLGRSYLTLERLDEAIDAYDKVLKLEPNNLEAMLSLGEAISMRAGGEITPPAAALFE